MGEFWPDFAEDRGFLPGGSGFAVRCVTTPPSGHPRWCSCGGAPLATLWAGRNPIRASVENYRLAKGFLALRWVRFAAPDLAGPQEEPR
ncbi:hypothetical protein SPHV1_230010 [Novosphingobium sp. KN65.2]|nr:hypothetical protein SPHV1_230010 [Novosphingobium sp. KN65.2]